MPLDDAFDERQPEPNSLLAGGHQRLEEPRAHRGIDTGSVVRDPDGNFGWTGLCVDCNGCSGPGCLLRVLEQVDEDLAELGRVAANRGKMRERLQAEGEVQLQGSRLDHVA